jgi:hypothetical protein
MFDFRPSLLNETPTVVPSLGYDFVFLLRPATPFVCSFDPRRGTLFEGKNMKFVNVWLLAGL